MEDNKFKNYEPCTIIFYDKRREVILKEPSLIAVDVKGGMVQAIGEEAEKYRDEFNHTIVVGSPFKNGVVADFEAARSMLKLFLQKTNQCKLFSRPRIAVCSAIDMTPVEYRTLHELMDAAGAKKTLIIEDSFVSAERSIPREYDLVVEIMLGECFAD